MADVSNRLNFRFYDEAERDFEMSAVGPERGRRSQRNASRKPTKTSRTMETDLSDYPSPVPHSPVASKSPTDSHAMESGYFNKYAIEEAERKADPAEAKAVTTAKQLHLFQTYRET